MLDIPPHRTALLPGTGLLVGGVGLIGLVFIGGCTDPKVIISDSLSAGNPAEVSGEAGPPPVPVEMLDITPTLSGGVPPTHVTRVNPQPILPKMDEAFGGRRLPEGVESGNVMQEADQREIPELSPVQQGEEDPADPGDGPAMEAK